LKNLSVCIQVNTKCRYLVALWYVSCMTVSLLQEYLERIDPSSHLGLDEQSISGYWLSATFRTFRK